MKLLYSGASEHLGRQGIPSKSLGGYISSVPIPNDFMNNLFSDISNRQLDNEFTDTRMIVIWNDGANDITDVTIHFTYEAEATSSLSLAGVLPTTDSCDKPIFESIQSGYAKPYYGNFSEADGVGNAVNLGDLAADEYMGIWLIREIDYDSENFLKNKTCDNLYSIHIGESQTVTTKEKITMVINYTEGGSSEESGLPYSFPFTF